MSKRILFTEEDLINLLKGKVIKFDGVEIALQDIGYDRIFKALMDNETNL
jgi:hypothetical protein